MANLNNPFGLRSLGVTIAGGAPVIEVLTKLAAYGTAIFRGDAVNRVSGSSLQASATPGTTLYSGVSLNYSAASTLADHYVVVDPNAIYVVQSGNGTPTTTGIPVYANQVGLNANLSLGAGGAATRLSGHILDVATIATTSTLDLHILRSYRDATNDLSSPQYLRFEVTFNKHRMAAATAGV